MICHPFDKDETMKSHVPLIVAILSMLFLLPGGMIPAAFADSLSDKACQRLVEAGWRPEMAEAIVAHVTRCQGRVIAVFDHYNTLVSGDITEGNGKSQPGLSLEMLEKGQFRKPLGVTIPRSFKNNLREFYHDWAKHNPREAYAWICTMFAGFPESEIVQMAETYYAARLQPFIFPEMKRLVQVLQTLGVEVFIVSASAEPLVRAAAKWFGLPESRVHGVKLSLKDGIIQPRVRKPISFAEGKTDYIQTFLGPIPKGNLLVFGDSWRTDGHMLRYSTRQGGFSLLVNPSPELIPTLDQHGVHYFTFPSKSLLDR